MVPFDHEFGQILSLNGQAFQTGLSIDDKTKLPPAKASGAVMYKKQYFSAGSAWSYQPDSADNTVTVLRFCDQQEMLAQTATGRSLPKETVFSRFRGTPLETR